MTTSMQAKQYISPATSVFVLSPKDRLMWELGESGGMGGHSAPIRHPLD